MSRDLRRVREGVAGAAAVELVLEPVERVALELADTLARNAQLLADRLERDRIADEAVAQLDDPALPLGQLRERLLHGLALDRLRCVLCRIGCGGVAEQVAELCVAV